MANQAPAISELLIGAHNNVSNFSSVGRLSAHFSPKSAGTVLAAAGLTSCLGLPGGIVGLIGSFQQLKGTFTWKAALISLSGMATNAAGVANSIFVLPNRALALACGVLAHEGKAVKGLATASHVFSLLADAFFAVILGAVALSSTVSCYEEIKFLAKLVWHARKGAGAELGSAVQMDDAHSGKHVAEGYLFHRVATSEEGATGQARKNQVMQRLLGSELLDECRAAAAEKKRAPELLGKVVKAVCSKLVKNLITTTLCLGGIAGLIMLAVPSTAAAVVPVGLALVLTASIWLALLDLQDFISALQRGEVGRYDQMLLLLSSLLCLVSMSVAIGLTAGLGLPIVPLVIALSICGIWLLSNTAMQLVIFLKSRNSHQTFIGEGK